MNKETHTKEFAIDTGEKIGWIAGIIVLCLFVCWMIYSAAVMVYDMKGPFTFNENTIAYYNKDYTIRSKVNVLDVVREKDKEPMYKIELTDIGKQFEIPESTYIQYIGDNANALTIEASTISMAVKASDFGRSWDEAKTYAVYRYKMPWSSDTISFTNSEVQQFFEMLCKNKSGFRCYELPFKYHSYTTGWSFNIDEKGSYTEWTNRQ